MIRPRMNRLPLTTLTAAQAALAIALTVWAIAPLVSEPAQPLAAQARPDSVEYADGAWQVAHGHGYVTFFNEHTSAFGHVAVPPRYPFGTSIALAPFSLFGGPFPRGAQLGARVIAILYVAAVVAAAWLLGSWLAAAAAALLLAVTPFATASASVVLSDALASLLTVTILITLAAGGGRRSAAAAGALCGALLCVRLLGVVSLPALALALDARRRLVAGLFVVPFLGVLGIYQWSTFGSPLKTGYSYWNPGLREFSPSYLLGHTSAEGPYIYPDKLNGALLHGVCPCAPGGPMSSLRNLAFYPSVLIGLFWVLAPPLTGVVGLWEAFRDRSTPAARFTLVTVVLNLVVVLFYWDRAARFVAPAVSLLIIYAGVAIARLLSSAGHKARSYGWRRRTFA